MGKTLTLVPSSTPASPLEEEIDRWLDDCRARGLSPATVNRSYSQATKQVLLPFCRRRGLDAGADLDRRVLQDLAIELHARIPNKHTVAHYLRTINQFLSWLGVKDPAQKAPLPKLRKVARDVLTLAEMRSLEASTASVRDGLIIRLLADMGCRLGELAAVRLNDPIERAGAYFVNVSGKTGPRMVPVTPEVMRRLRTFTSRQRPRSGSDRLFLQDRRRPGSGEFDPLGESGVYQVVKDAAARLGWSQPGWTRRVYPHLLRHSAITRAVARGMHPALVSEIFGVSVAVIASHYSHPSPRERYDALVAALIEGGS